MTQRLNDTNGQNPLDDGNASAYYVDCHSGDLSTRDASNVNADKSPSGAGLPDSNEPSELSRTIREDAESRKRRIDAIRKKIDTGEYDTEERMEKALDAMLKKMRGSE